MSVVGNNTQNNSLMDALLTLKDNTMRSTHVAEICKVVELRANSQVKITPINNSKDIWYAYNMYGLNLATGQIVLVIFTDTDNRTNLYRNASNTSTQYSTSAKTHSSDYGIIIGSSGSAGAILYNETGNNTNGSMTQAATTTELEKLNALIKTNASNIATNASNIAAIQENYVTTNTTQTITGAKTFKSPVVVNQDSMAGDDFQVIRGNYNIGFGIGGSGVNRGIYDRTNALWLVYTDSTPGKVYVSNGGTYFTADSEYLRGSLTYHTNISEGLGVVSNAFSVYNYSGARWRKLGTFSGYGTNRHLILTINGNHSYSENVTSNNYRLDFILTTENNYTYSANSWLKKGANVTQTPQIYIVQTTSSFTFDIYLYMPSWSEHTVEVLYDSDNNSFEIDTTGTYLTSAPDGSVAVTNTLLLDESNNGMSRGSTSSYSWAKIPTINGTLLVQWGTTGNISSEGSATITIQPYNASKQFASFAIPDRNTSSGAGVVVCYTYPNASNQIRIQKDYTGSGSSIDTYCSWMTIGLI